jgi:hypothetical protein
MYIHTNNLIGSKNKNTIFNLTNVRTVYLGGESIPAIYLEYAETLETIYFDSYDDAVVAFQSLGV